MSALVTPFAGTVFLHSINTLEWTQTATELSVLVEIVIAHQKVLSTRLYYPPNGGRVAIHNVAELLLPYIDNEFGIDEGFDAWYSVQIITDGVVKRALVVPTTVHISETLESFAKRNFLSLLSGKKKTPEGEIERVTIYSHQEETNDLVVESLWEYQGQYQKRRQTLNAQQYIEGMTFWWAEVNPREFFSPHPLARLVQYQVVFGHRKQLFEVIPGIDADVTTFSFVNSFGQLDKFHAFGVVTEEHKYDRSLVQLGGEKKIYNVSVTPEYEVSTGEMDKGVRTLFEDLLRSRYVWIGQTPIVITDAIHKPSNSIHTLSNSKLTYQYAKGESVEVNKVRNVFDNTFDNTFA